MKDMDTSKLTGDFTGVLSKRELIIKIYNEQLEQVIRFSIDKRTAERMLLSVDTQIKRDAEQMLGKIMPVLNFKKKILETCFDELVEVMEEEKAKGTSL